MKAMVNIPIGEAFLQVPQSTVLRAQLAALGATALNEEPIEMKGIPPIGTYWDGEGGVNAGLMRGVKGQPDYYLIVATDEGSKFGDVPWGSQGTKVEGADCEFDGMKNTLALIDSGNDHPAAEKCRSLCLDKHCDFYLPARRELALCFANVPELFEKRWHWSSTQYSARGAWGQNFDGGSQFSGSKDAGARVRAVRRFSPSSI